MTLRRVGGAAAAACLVAAVVARVDVQGAGAQAAASTVYVTQPAAGSAAGDASHDYPFYATTVDLKAAGYVEQEFFIEGTANRYTTPAASTGAAGSVIDGGHPYKTRIVVRRPATQAKFNGTVVVEWNNVTAGHDLDIDWFQAHDYLIRSGYAWVGVTPQRIGVEALKVWNAKRYGSLDVTAGGTVANDDLSYDIFTAAAQVIRRQGSQGSINVMGGLRIERMFATGHSQSASRLATYVNAVHPLQHVFDAVIIHGGGGRVRTDLDVKVWKLSSETDVLNGQAASRQPDSDKFRHWEVAGDSHVDLQFVTYSRQLSQRDGSPVAPGFTPGGAPRGGATPAAAPAAPAAARGTTNAGGCDRPSYSHIPFYFVMDAAIDHLVKWVKDGTLPPTAPEIEVSSVGPPVVVVRDKAGNALGGIRLSQHAVPTATNTGQNSGPGFCRLNGSYEPFDAATLASLYPTHAGYVAAVRDVTAKNVKAGYILQPEADQTIAEAEKSAIGGR